MSSRPRLAGDPEIATLGRILHLLSLLPVTSRERIITYVISRWQELPAPPNGTVTLSADLFAQDDEPETASAEAPAHA